MQCQKQPIPNFPSYWMVLTRAAAHCHQAFTTATNVNRKLQHSSSVSQYFSEIVLSHDFELYGEAQVLRLTPEADNQSLSIDLRPTPSDPALTRTRHLKKTMHTRGSSEPIYAIHLPRTCSCQVSTETKRVRARAYFKVAGSWMILA